MNKTKAVAAKAAKVDRSNVIYSIQDAIEFVKKNSKNTFDATIELHINFNLDVKKADQLIRFSTSLPNGTGKTKKVAVLASKKVANADLELAESDIEKLEKGTLRPKVDFDVLVAEPRYMAKLAKAARVLGPAGVMPNPKNGTVAEDVEKAVDLIKKGKVDVRTEQLMPMAHTIMGKKSFTTEALVQNFEEIMSTLKQAKPNKAKPDWIKSVYIAGSMSPSARVDITKYLG